MAERPGPTLSADRNATKRLDHRQLNTFEPLRVSPPWPPVVFAEPDIARAMPETDFRLK